MATRQELLDAVAVLKAKLAEIGPADRTKATEARNAISSLTSDATQMVALADTFDAASGAEKQQLIGQHFGTLLRANAATNRKLATLIEAVVRDQQGG